MKPLRCPKCRSIRLTVGMKYSSITDRVSGWRVMCCAPKPCDWGVDVSRREIVGTAILRWLAKDGGHIR